MYSAKLNNASDIELYTELSNVMSAKHNLMMFPMSILERNEKQKIITDLTDKSTTIFMHKLGRDKLIEFSKGNLETFNSLVNTLDNQVSQLNLPPEEHGHLLIKTIEEMLNNK